MLRVGSSRLARLLIFGLDVVSRLSEGANCLSWNELESYLDVLMGLARTRRGFKQPPLGNQLNFQLTANLSFPFPRGLKLSFRSKLRKLSV